MVDDSSSGGLAAEPPDSLLAVVDMRGSAPQWGERAEFQGTPLVCCACGGDSCYWATGPDRWFSVRTGMRILLPTDFRLRTCQECGESMLDGPDAEAVDRLTTDYYTGPIGAGHVVQLSPDCNAFGGCFMLVEEVKASGSVFVGYVQQPVKRGEPPGRYYYRVSPQNCSVVGFASWVPRDVQLGPEVLSAEMAADHPPRETEG